MGAFRAVGNSGLDRGSSGSARFVQRVELKDMDEDDENFAEEWTGLLRDIVHANGVKIFVDGFDGLDRLRAEAKRLYGIDITDEQMNDFKYMLAKAVASRKRQ